MFSKLNDEQKTYVVTRLAVYDKPAAIARDLKEEFGVTITPEAVGNYHPDRVHRRVAQRWKDLFAETRKAYIAKAADVGAMHKPVRILWREGLAHDAWAAGLFKHASDILDAIAKDFGDVFTHKQRHEHGKRAAPTPGTIIINGRPLLGPASEATGRVRKPRD
jgi:hypothetical protein